MNNRTEYEYDYAVSVGAVLSGDLEYMEMSQAELAKKTGVSKTVINEIIKGKRKMPVDVAIKFEPIFGAPAKYWLDVQSNYEITKRKKGMYLINAGETIQSGKVTAIEVAAWFANRAIEDANEDEADYMTNLRIQKLLFLAQEQSLKKNRSALFVDPILHWTFGPVVKSVYDKYSALGKGQITAVEKVELDADVNAFLEEVYQTFKKYSTSGLVTITHRKPAWESTAQGEEITLECIMA